MLVVVVGLNHTLYERNSLLMEIAIRCSCMFYHKCTLLQITEWDIHMAMTVAHLVLHSSAGYALFVAVIL